MFLPYVSSKMHEETGRSELITNDGNSGMVDW
jgi:hypothetical protein